MMNAALKMIISPEDYLISFIIWRYLWKHFVL